LKCKKCGRPASIKLVVYNLKLCDKHFLEFIESRVENAIKKFKMFTRKDRILVAVSGGKDSMVLWYILVKLGYNADGLFIKLGHDYQVSPAYEKVKKLSDMLNRPLIIEDATEYLYGLSTFEAAKILRRPACSFCGMVKRYLMNKAAVENDYDVLVTGHNLDDEATVLLGNILHWQTGYITRSYPVLEKTHEKFVKKAKPLVLNYEEHIKLYAKKRGIDFLPTSCPFSLGATSKIYKNIIRQLEDEQRGITLSFYLGYLREKENIFKIEENTPQLHSCEVCGYPTTAKVCSFCRSRRRLQEKLERKNSI